MRRKKKKNKPENAQRQGVVLEEKDMTSASCPMFGRCGGCTYQDIVYTKQLEMKNSWVHGLLEKAGISDYEALPPLASPDIFGYRNKMEFSFGDAEKDGPLNLGLHERGKFFNVLPAQDCTLVHEDVRRIVAAARAYFREIGATYYHKRSHAGFLRHLVVRRGQATGEIMVNLVTTSETALDADAFLARLKALPFEGSLKTVIHTVNDGLGDVVKADDLKILLGDGVIHDNILGIDFEISPFSFFQTNTRGAAVLYTAVKDAVMCGWQAAGRSQKPDIFDLYCGVGTIAQVLSPIAHHVTGIELVPEAIAAAKQNAAHNHIDNCTFIAGDVKNAVAELAEKPEIIVIDPPRDGIHPKALPDMLSFAPACFVYVSCKAPSLARDLPYFVSAGYQVQSVQCVDMFPQTPHIETVAFMTKNRSGHEKIS